MSTINPIEVAADTVDANVTPGGITETLLDALKKRVTLAFGPTESLGDFDFSAGSPPLVITYGATGYVYFYNADDTTTPDDGLTCLVSADGRRYIIADMSAVDIAAVLAMQNAPPGSPAAGDAYVVDVAPSGAWVGHAKDVALYTPRGWVFAQAKVGTALLNETTGLNIQYSALGAWGSMSTSITSGGVAPGQLLFPMGLSVEAQQNAPPGSPGANDGLYYLVGLVPTGAWSGKANKVATYDSTSTWVFLSAYDGAKIFNKASDAELTWFDATGDWRPQWPIAGECHGRLTLATGTPITSTDQTAKATLYFTPFRGNTIALYVNGGWSLRNFTELSIALAGKTSGKPYDVFAYDNAGTVAIEDLVWTNDTTRATALALQDGIYVKNGDATRRYLGTYYTTATGQTEDSVAKRMVWNYYNRVKRPMRVNTTGLTSWTASVNGFRQVRGNTTYQLEFVIGVAEDVVEGRCQAMSNGGNSTPTYGMAIGLDSTTTRATGCIGVPIVGSAGSQVPASAEYEDIIAAGRHLLVWLETSGTTGQTVTFYGDNGSGNVAGSGFVATVLA